MAASIDAAERAMREAEPTAQVIYVEPDIYVESHEPDPRPEPPAAAGALTGADGFGVSRRPTGTLERLY